MRNTEKEQNFMLAVSVPPTDELCGNGIPEGDSEHGLKTEERHVI